MQYDDLDIKNMKRYIPNVVLYATPMTLGEYAVRSNQPLKDGEDPDTDGYLVLQGKSEDEMYTSWYKADAFVLRFKEI